MSLIKLHQFREKLELRGYAKRTVKDYSGNLELFFRYLKHEEDVDDIDAAAPEHIRAYQAYLTFKKLKGESYLTTKTVRSRLLAVKAFFQIMHEEGLVPANFGASITMPKARKHLPRNIPDEKEMLKLLNAVPLSKPIGIRDRCILEVLYATGIRNQELRGLCLSDFDRNERTFLIRSGKGGKDRVVPIGDWVMPYLLEYLELGRPKLIHSETGLLFLSKTGRKITFGNLGDMIRKYKNKARIETPVTPHTFRHACATHMLKGGADIRYVQELLGHADLSSTQIYTRVAIGDLQEAHRKYHPRDKQEGDRANENAR